jgi:HSP20 family protein
MSEETTGRGTPDMPQAHERLNSLWQAIAGHPAWSGPREGVWHPTVDVYEQGERVVVLVELPGMKGQEMDVAIEEEHLIIEGARVRSEVYGEEDAYYCERPYGSFRRVIHLPYSVDESAVSARYDDGLLVVSLPRSVRERARRIEIR